MASSTIDSVFVDQRSVALWLVGAERFAASAARRMTLNEGLWDRVIRILVGLLLAYAASITRLGTGATIAFLVIGGIALVTGLTGWCLLYRVFHISTRKKAAV